MLPAHAACIPSPTHRRLPIYDCPHPGLHAKHRSTRNVTYHKLRHMITVRQGQPPRSAPLHGVACCMHRRACGGCAGAAVDTRPRWLWHYGVYIRRTCTIRPIFRPTFRPIFRLLMQAPQVCRSTPECKGQGEIKYVTVLSCFQVPCFECTI